MNEMENKLLLARDKFMPEMYLKQAGFTYSICGTLLKKKERIKNLRNNIFIKINQIKLVFNMIWLMKILNI